MNFNYAEMKDSAHAARIGIEHFGPKCEIPNLILRTPEKVMPHQKRVYNRFLEYFAVKKMLHAWEAGTWMYILGFRHSNQPSIITQDAMKAIQRTGHASAIRCIALKLSAFEYSYKRHEDGEKVTNEKHWNETGFELEGEAPCHAVHIERIMEATPLDNLQFIVRAELTGDLESGILNVHHVEDITGEGSDGLDPDGRFRLLEYFGISTYNGDRNQRLVNELMKIRLAQPALPLAQ